MNAKKLLTGAGGRWHAHERGIRLASDDFSKHIHPSDIPYYHLLARIFRFPGFDEHGDFSLERHWRKERNS